MRLRENWWNRNRKNKSRQDYGESGADEPRRTDGIVPFGTDGGCRKESDGTGEYQIERATSEIKRELEHLDGKYIEPDKPDQGRPERSDPRYRSEKRRTVPEPGSGSNEDLRETD